MENKDNGKIGVVIDWDVFLSFGSDLEFGINPKVENLRMVLWIDNYKGPTPESDLEKID